MILQIMREVNNFFAVNIVNDTFKIVDKKLNLYEFGFLSGQYVAVTGSILNNNVYLVNNDFTIDLAEDEDFSGSVIGLAPPADFLELVADITKTSDKEISRDVGITSERFENYAWTAATDKNGNVVTWQNIFNNQLNKYRKMYNGVKI